MTEWPKDNSYKNWGNININPKVHKTWTKVKSGKVNFFFFKKEEYKPQVITPPIIIKSPLLKFKENKIFKSNFVIIAKIPNTEIIKPKIWNLLVVSIFSKKHKRIIVAGIAVLKREALITWVWTNDKYVNELNSPTLVKAKKNNNGKLFNIISLFFNTSL